MNMGLGAGFGMMMPGMLRDAMGAGAAATATAQQPASPAPVAATYAATVADAPKTAASPAAFSAAAASSAGGLDFGDLSPATADPRSLIRTVVQSAGYALQENGDLWNVTVPIGTLRKQVVRIQFGEKDDSGHEIVTYSSTCGPFNDKNAAALLRYNTKTVYAAFAVQAGTGGEQLLMRTNQLAESLDPLAVGRVIAAIAWQADKVEEKLLGTDEN
jgi:hypothetical protein